MSLPHYAIEVNHTIVLGGIHCGGFSLVQDPFGVPHGMELLKRGLNFTFNYFLSFFYMSRYFYLKTSLVLVKDYLFYFF